MPPASQGTVSTVPLSNYDRISNIITPSAYISHRRPTEREAVVSEEYLVELEQQRSDRRPLSNQRQISFIDTKQQRTESSEGNSSDSYVIIGDNSYHDLTRVVNEAGERRNSGWRDKLKQMYSTTYNDVDGDDRFDQVTKIFCSLIFHNEKLRTV